MLNVFPTTFDNATAQSRERKADFILWLWIGGLLAATCMVGLLLLRRGPEPADLLWAIYFLGIGAIFYRPRYGIYLIVLLALLGDARLTYWYPFVKNFSSAESLMFVHNGLIISPAESYMGLTLLSWLGRICMRHRRTWYRGPLFIPALVFIGFITYGLIYGLARGGDLVIGLWEARPIFYLPMMLILVSNLLEKRTHIHQLIWAAMLGIFLDGLIGFWHVATVLNFEMGTVDRIAEHSSSIHANSFFVLLLAVWLFRGSTNKRMLLLLLLPVVAISYLANQRRAAFIALGIALVLMGLLLYLENRRLFWRLAPVAVVLGLVYLAIFWNSYGALGLPARAVKSIIAPTANASDYASNLYRQLENTNIHFTITTAPLRGVGFGNKFFIIVQMADISFFDWWEYITHNSILWIWMKAGLGGFISLIILIGMTIVVGTRRFLQMPQGDLRAIVLTAMLYVVMHFIFAYVDMSWDAQSMIYVGTMMGLINCTERIVGRPVPLPARRWPWQAKPRPAPGLQPL
jgi:hypothetical protein